MAIAASYDRILTVGLEAVVFLDDESGDCFQIHRDLPGDASRECRPGYFLTTGVGAPIANGVVAWRVTGQIFEFILDATAARMFGGVRELSFEVDSESFIEEIADHLRRFIGPDR